jgi:peptide/nickel transport system substrate-binding protein
MDRRKFLITSSASAATLALPGYLRAAPRVEFRWIPQTDLTLLDPTFTTATITQNHAQMVFDTLYGMDNDYQPHPQMASGHEMDPDGLRWVITLRDQLVFHDGSPVRAQDAVASLQRWALRDLMGKSLMEATAELTALNDKQLQFKLKKPFPLLLHALGRQTGSMAAVMPERLAKGPADKPVTEMIGSGPFRFVRDQWVSGSRVVYEKFAGYVPRKDSFPPQFSAGPKNVYMDECRWNVVPDRATAIAALQAHEVDGVESVDNDFIGMLKADPSITLLKRSLPTVAILRFNHLQPPFDNVLMRRAVLGSINQTEYMTAINGTEFKEYWSDRMGIFVVGTPMATEAGMDKLTGKRDLDKVRADIKAAGYKGETIVLIDPADFPAYHAAALLTADIFKRIGLKVDVQTMDWGTAVQRRNNQDAPSKGGWNVAFTGLTGPNNLDPAGHLALRGNGKQAWWGWPTSARLEQLRQDWFNAPDLAAQKKICEQIQLQVIEDVPYIPLGATYQVSAIASEWKDFQPQLPLFYTVRKA